MAVITSRDIGADVCAALGLTDATFVQITFPREGIVEVTCRYYPTAEAVDTFVSVLKRYHLHAVEVPPAEA
jgi:hypothetical protein